MSTAIWLLSYGFADHNRNCVLHEFGNAAVADSIAASEPASEWRTRIEGSVARPLGSAVVAERLWPQA